MHSTNGYAYSMLGVYVYLKEMFHGSVSNQMIKL